MDGFFEEYGFIILSAICAVIISVAIQAAVKPDGFIGETVIEFVTSLIGG